MNDRKTEIRNRIVAHIAKMGRCPSYATVGTDYYEGSPIVEELFNDGTLIRVERLSPKGKRMKHIELGPKVTPEMIEGFSWKK